MSITLDNKSSRISIQAMNKFVYFAGIDAGSPIKIGQSKSPEERAVTLSVKLLGSFASQPRDEILLHQMFAHLNIHGEWFRDHKSLRSFIAKSDAEKRQILDRYRDAVDSAKGPKPRQDTKPKLAQVYGMPPHPLEIWLRAKEIKAYQFAQKHGFYPRTLYAFINGEVMDPKPSHLSKIEKATKGEVTSGMQAKWFAELWERNSNAKERA